MLESVTALPSRLIAMGGTYGNVAALDACLADARRLTPGVTAFLGDSIGCSAHSEEVVRAIRESFSVLVAGNHEQEAARASESCGCGYASPEDEAISCEAFRLATEALRPETRAWLGTWPDRAIVELAGGRVLLCHGSPGNTNEFLYEVELDDQRLLAWLDAFEVRGFVCTHSGLPWVRRLSRGRFAMNCGAVGKPDHDGDPAVHYGVIELPDEGPPALEIRRVAYDHLSFANKLEGLGVPDIFVRPLRTGVWTSGVASLPAAERGRPLRAIDARGETLSFSAERCAEVLGLGRELRLVTRRESDEVLRLLGPDSPFFAATRLADSIHVHVRVDDTSTLPASRFFALGAREENAREGYVKYAFPGGINLIFSSIDVSEEDLLPERRPRPFVDHVGIDLRRETGIVRARFEEIPAIAQRIGWAHVPQGGPGRTVRCCHTEVAAKHWVYPPPEGAFGRPLELAYGPLVVSGAASGCDLRPIDPRHPAAPGFVGCAPASALQGSPAANTVADPQGDSHGRLLSLGGSRALR
jgi:diadenosine tetraphosphatase ApaH/serine/threonine PP2A family protein phosphatase